MEANQLQPGDYVTMVFHGDNDVTETYVDSGTFLRSYGEGENQRLIFESAQESRNGWYEWEAYRHNGSWAFGSSANLLEIVRSESICINVRKSRDVPYDALSLNILTTGGQAVEIPAGHLSKLKKLIEEYEESGYLPNCWTSL